MNNPIESIVKDGISKIILFVNNLESTTKESITPNVTEKQQMDTIAENIIQLISGYNITMKGDVKTEACKEGTALLVQELSNLLTTLQIIKSNGENGKTLCKYLTMEVKGVLESVISHLNIYVEEKDGPEREKNATRMTTVVWKYCKNIKAFEYDDTIIIRKEVKEGVDLIADAISDLKNMLQDKGMIDLNDFAFEDDDDDSEDNLNEKEKLMINPLITLLQTAKGLVGSFDGFLFSPLKKERSGENKEKRKKVVKWLENFLSYVKNICKEIDDATTLIYPPQNQDKIVEKTMEIHNLLLKGIHSLQIASKKLLVEQKDKENINRVIGVVQGMMKKQKEQLDEAIKK